MSPEDRDEWARQAQEAERRMIAASRLTAGDWGWIILWSVAAFIIAIVSLLP